MHSWHDECGIGNIERGWHTIGPIFGIDPFCGWKCPKCRWVCK